jgi:hypothetical protein
MPNFISSKSPPSRGCGGQQAAIRVVRLRRSPSETIAYSAVERRNVVNRTSFLIGFGGLFDSDSPGDLLGRAGANFVA